MNTTPPPFAPLGSATVLPVMPTFTSVLNVTPGGSPCGAFRRVVCSLVGVPGTVGPVGTTQREPLSSSLKLGLRAGYGAPLVWCAGADAVLARASPGDVFGSRIEPLTTNLRSVVPIRALPAAVSA